MTRHSRRADTNRDLALTRDRAKSQLRGPTLCSESVQVLGLVPTKRGELESKDDLKRRIDAAFVDGDQLCLSPQCGLSSTKEGNDLTAGQQWAKLALIVETAQEVWGT